MLSAEAKARKNAKARERYLNDPAFREKCRTRVRPVRECTECHRMRMHQGKGLCDGCYANMKRRLNPERSRAWEQKYRDKNRERERARLRAYYAKTKTKQMVNAARWRAKQAGVPFNLTEHDVEIPMFCPVLGIPIEQSTKRKGRNSPALDRIIPILGYVRGNVRVISDRANTLKRDGTLEEFRSLVRYLEAHGHIRTRAS